MVRCGAMLLLSKRQHREWLQWRNRHLAELRALGFAAAALLLVLLLRWRTTATAARPAIGGNIPACTFAQLYAAFPPVGTAQSSSSSSSSNSSGCWKLADEIVRVPVSAVLNRNALVPLGSGMLGGVHKAVIELVDSSSNPQQQEQQQQQECVAAVKTDHCHGHSSWGLGWQRVRSCLEDGAHFWSPRSFLGAEYTGALVWYAQLQEEQETTATATATAIARIPGLLPTWAVLVDPSRARQNDLRQHPDRIEGFPHPDPTVQGVLMPLMPLTPASNLLDDDATVLYRGPRTLPTLAEMMLPAARGLAFVGSLGLAFRDLIEKNVGILDDSTAVVYDNSLMGYNPEKKHCARQYCNFCHEPDVFPPFDDHYHRVVKGIRAGHPYITGDLHNFRNAVLRLADRTNLSEAGLRQFAVDVRQTKNANHLVRVLQNYSLTTTATGDTTTSSTTT